ncbi:MAG: helix-turn-helix domain-containing protein [Hydrogenophaga sp.]|uniref:helix-turn-helix domain-containing protein n=1 Tax=Hydrogenophaga sp. TaxID=1904254 RepID=UPI0040356CDB
MNENIRLLLGARLREERERLGLSQLVFGALGDISLRTEQDWERGVSAVKSDFLNVVAQHGVDVLYVVTGERLYAKLTLDPIQSAVLGSLAQCSPQRQMEAVQHMALLAAGMSPQTPAGRGSPLPSVNKPAVKKPVRGVGVAKARKGK